MHYLLYCFLFQVHGPLFCNSVLEVGVESTVGFFLLVSLLNWWVCCRKIARCPGDSVWLSLLVFDCMPQKLALTFMSLPMLGFSVDVHSWDDWVCSQKLLQETWKRWLQLVHQDALSCCCYRLYGVFVSSFGAPWELGNGFINSSFVLSWIHVR